MLCADPGSGRYRYSPERLKNAVSCQAEDFPAEGRHGRRRSGKIVPLPLHILNQCFCFMKTTLKPSHQSRLVTYDFEILKMYIFLRDSLVRRFVLKAHCLCDICLRIQYICHKYLHYASTISFFSLEPAKQIVRTTKGIKGNNCYS
jgi:hypothetical protein